MIGALKYIVGRSMICLMLASRVLVADANELIRIKSVYSFANYQYEVHDKNGRYIEQPKSSLFEYKEFKNWELTKNIGGSAGVFDVYAIIENEANKNADLMVVLEAKTKEGNLVKGKKIKCYDEKGYQVKTVEFMATTKKIKIGATSTDSVKFSNLEMERLISSKFESDLWPYCLDIQITIICDICENKPFSHKIEIIQKN